MSANEIFKTEFKGYSKKEVIEYISSLNEQMESLKAELDSVESELEKCRAELLEKESAKPEPEPEPVDVEAACKEAFEQGYARAKAEFEAAATDDSELEELRAKAEMYDAQKDLIAEIMIKAKSDALTITTEADKRAKELMETTFAKYEKAREDFIQMRKNVEAGKAELEARIAAVSHYIKDFSQYLAILENDVVNTGENFKNNL